MNNSPGLPAELNGQVDGTLMVNHEDGDGHGFLLPHCVDSG